MNLTQYNAYIKIWIRESLPQKNSLICANAYSVLHNTRKHFTLQTVGQDIEHRDNTCINSLDRKLFNAYLKRRFLRNKLKIKFFNA